MTKENQIRLDALMLRFRALYKGDNRVSFESEWKPFFNNLSVSEKETAAQAWFKAIFDNLGDIKKDVADLVENGTEQECKDYLGELQKIKALPIFDKNMVST